MASDFASCLGVIPARAGSTRFPLKILAPIDGKPMVQHVWEAASRARSLTDLVVATDDAGIQRAVEAFGGRAVMTGEHASGTDRVAAVARDRAGELVVNLQGDEPLLDPESIDRLVAALAADPATGMATLAVRREDADGLHDPNVVKVVTSPGGEALYFSREPLRMDARGAYLKHVGIYAFRRATLEAFCRWEPSALERAERLEQLRALAHGVRVRVVTIDRDLIAVDTPADVGRVERALKGLGRKDRISS